MMGAFWAALLVLHIGPRPHPDPCRVRIRDGDLRGTLDSSAADSSFCSFKGIPYARPPIGALRLQSPERHPGWSGVRDASEHGNRCLQVRRGVLGGSEDCLFVNVYTRRAGQMRRSSFSALPVMVFIHGGFFSTGSGDADKAGTPAGPHYFMDEAVVLVTLNYRLSALGFLSTGDSSAPGNYGLLDQRLALQWVQDNIADFGGDPGRVTLFGHSAGAISVGLHVLSPLSRGLFHRAISMSGSTLASNGGRRSDAAAKFAALLDCPTDATSAMVSCIREAPSDKLSSALIAANAGRDPTSFIPMFTPIIDVLSSQYPFVPQDPRTILEDGKFDRMPWMIGITSEESRHFLPYIVMQQSLAASILDKDLNAWGLLADLTQNKSLIGQFWPIPVLDCGTNATDEVQKVLDFYAGDGEVTYATIARVLSDRLFVGPATEEIRLASKHTQVYKYLFDHTGAGRQTRPDPFHGLPDLGVKHGDDQLYVFSDGSPPYFSNSSATYNVTRFLTNLLVNFARDGEPSSTVLDMPDWPAFDEQSQQHMHLRYEDPKLGDHLFDERIQFWRTVALNDAWKQVVVYSCP